MITLKFLMKSALNAETEHIAGMKDIQKMVCNNELMRHRWIWRCFFVIKYKRIIICRYKIDRATYVVYHKVKDGYWRQRREQDEEKDIL